MSDIKIESFIASQSWEGELDLNDWPTDAAKLEVIFRCFNRVTDEDNERLERLGYTLPSLSVGDLVTIDDRSYRCESVGWKALDSTE